MSPIPIAPGVVLWREWFDRAAQQALVDTVFALAERAPFYKPVMPKTGKPFSVEETNFGTLGWVSDKSSYRYQPTHPITGEAWARIPEALLALWKEISDYSALPECCLVNLYREGAKMGAHQDRDEQARDAPVVSVSLGDDALFSIAGDTRKSVTRSITLSSGDVLMFGGVARDAFHGIDRIKSGSSTLIPGSGRLNLTLRRIKPVQQQIKTPGQGG